jgi:GTPase SAR1 family protein
MVVNLDPACE